MTPDTLQGRELERLRESVQQALALSAQLCAERDEARARCSRLEEALRRIDSGGCEHFVTVRCAELPEYTEGAEEWADRLCNPCVAHRALTALASAPTTLKSSRSTPETP